MIVGICKLDLHIPGCRSLKEKRQALRHIKDRTAHAFGIRPAEVDFLDMWQRAGMGFAAVGNDRRVIEGLMQRIVNSLEDSGRVLVADWHFEFVDL